MATTKAKAKVKTVVKNKAKVTTKKGAPAKKSSTTKKAAAPKAASKKAVPAKKGLTKKSAPLKVAVKKSKNAPAKMPIKKVVAPKKGNKVEVKKTSKETTKALSKAPIKKNTVVEKLLPKKAAATAKDEPVKKAKFEFPKKRAGRKPKSKGDEDDGFELLEVPKLEPISKKPAKKKFVIPVNPEVYVNPLAKPVPIPKNMGTYKKFEIEFPIHASPYIIYSFISTPAGLSEWFAENVNVRNDEYTFLWDGSQQTATLLSKKENTFMKFRWNDEPDFTFFEFRIVVDEITQDVAFWVTDFAEDEKSREASEMLWHSQIDALIHAMGA